ncbi:MAG: ribonuclease P protein component [Candidatus Latescibacteria bacterium]|nr:ribonuclease P protein component [Candidatus Latescibacterota bacterium]
MHFSLNPYFIRKIRSDGSTYRSDTVTVKYVETDDYRYSPVISKKQGNAVKRNRVKRIIRHVMTSKKCVYPRGLYFIYVNKDCALIDYPMILDELNNITKKISVR